jgi:hypothetical protein
MATLATHFRRPLETQTAARSAPGPAPAEDPFRLRSLPNEDVFLFSKRIDNSRIVREPDPAKRGEWSFLGAVWLLAVLLMVALTPRVANVFAGYQLEALKQEEQRLLDEQRMLDVMEARLSRQENLEELAKQDALATPAPGQVFHLDPKHDSKLALNRH